MQRNVCNALLVCAISVLGPSMLQAQAADPALSALRAQWSGAIDNITKAAEEMTEANFAYKPVATVRSFGELIAHVAGSQDMICAAALGEPAPAEDAVEKAAKTKAAIVKALKASTEHCKKAYAMSASAAGLPADLFGEKNTRIGALALNAVHDGEHYGNVVTYMRMKGMVPPSSKK
jgi:uncharacterized damage-inducible protein DinB